MSSTVLSSTFDLALLGELVSYNSLLPSKSLNDAAGGESGEPIMLANFFGGKCAGLKWYSVYFNNFNVFPVFSMANWCAY